MKTPNFFIVGAPKTGTTSLADYLRDHPHAFVSDPKEPGYWADDLKIRERTGITTEASYASLFADAGSATALGEASTLYLYSENAIGNIMRKIESPKFVVGLRNPLDMAPGVHMQNRLVGREDVSDFATAWRLQDNRKGGKDLPHCKYDDVKLLDYRAMCSIGTQLQRLFSLAPHNQIYVYFYEDLCRSTETIYRDILKFLELEDDGRKEFKKSNQSRDLRSSFFANQLHSLGGRRLVTAIKSSLPTRMVEALKPLKNAIVYRADSKSPLKEDLAAEILAGFESEIQLVESLTKRDLTAWRGKGKLVG